jgi:hypothetical protein
VDLNVEICEEANACSVDRQRCHLASSFLTSSNPSSLGASMQNHRVTLPTGNAKTMKDAYVSGQCSRLVLNPAAKIISSATRQIIDCPNALFAERHEHQRGEPRNGFEFVCNTEFFSPRFKISFNLLRQTSVRIGRRGIDFDGI